ncbi:hypothetical protein ACFVWR_18490 [Leifsonia sp. NPDC058292]|uniref:hypothetical protein n=1 Tax=Leifsonia sp. NPDC058292 TaxID=3346428 RepID=UPI0036DF3254
MDIYTKEIVFAAAGITLVASPFIWAACDCVIRRWRRQRAQIRAILQDLRTQAARLEDAKALEVQRRSELLAAAPAVDAAERIVFEEWLRASKPSQP